ncbi:MAG: SdrD B-like domain-containing protein, partial [Actinomycetota bacterium]
MTTRIHRIVISAALLWGSVLVGSVGSPSGVAVAAPGDLSGQVFRDIDHDGVRNGTDRGEPGITVEVYDDGGLVDSTVTADDGTWSLTGLGDGPFRVEFAIPDDRPGVSPTVFPEDSTTGTVRNGTSVQFVRGAEATDVNFGVADPLTYCQTTNPRVGTVCYTNGNPTPGGKAVLEHDYLDTGRSVGGAQPEVDVEPIDAAVGGVWGLAFHRTTATMFAGAALKRHVGLGPGGIDAIYAGEREVDDPGAANDVAWFDGIDTSGTATVPSNTDRGLDGVGGADPSNDIDAFALVGTVGWGGIAVGADDTTLYGVNLGGKTLAAIGIDPATGGHDGTFTETAIPDPGCVGGEHRPWAVTERDGKVYVGVVCDASASELTTDLTAYVLVATPSGDPTTGGVTFDGAPATTFPLDYDGVEGNNDKGCAAQWRGRSGCRWNSWNSTFDPADYDIYDLTDDWYHRPVPILSDLAFDDEGYMVLAFTDRTGHQLGNYNHPPIAGSVERISTAIGGDMLIAAPDDATFTSWTIENDGTVGTRASAQAPNDRIQGPGGEEFFFEDQFSSLHRETSQGAVAYLPQSNEVIGTTMDPDRVRSAGLSTVSTTDGAEQRWIEYYEQGNTPAGPTFSKAGGLGD